MRRGELRKIAPTLQDHEIEQLTTLYITLGSEDRLTVLEKEEIRRSNPRHQDKRMDPKVSVKVRLTR